LSKWPAYRKYNAPPQRLIWNKRTNRVPERRKIYRLVHSGYTSVCSRWPNKGIVLDRRLDRMLDHLLRSTCLFVPAFSRHVAVGRERHPWPATRDVYDCASALGIGSIPHTASPSALMLRWAWNIFTMLKRSVARCSGWLVPRAS
jgi:hypothetical protein